MCKGWITSTSAKSVKQHGKSRPHKDAVRGKESKNESKLEYRPQQRCLLHDDDDKDGDENDGIVICHPEEDADSAVDVGDLQWVCIAPDVVSNPRKAVKTRKCPFVTWKALSREEDGESWWFQAEDVIERCCVAGGRRVPNIDLAGENLCVKSFSHAAELLYGAVRDGRRFWTSMQADDEVIHPEWWPLDRLVPTYTNVLMTQGINIGIGLHVDVDHYAKKGAVIDTYLTLVVGIKQVLMLPPGDVPQALSTLSAFPRALSKDTLRVIRAQKGFYFTLNACNRPATLYIPRGWHHWLISTSPFTVAFTASKY